MRITFIDNEAGGGSQHVNIREGMTIREVMAQQKPGLSPASFTIRHNNRSVSGDNIDGQIHPGDKLSVTPRKIEGAIGDALWALYKALSRHFTGNVG